MFEANASIKTVYIFKKLNRRSASGGLPGLLHLAALTPVECFSSFFYGQMQMGDYNRPPEN
jgi:hypothetical protein